MNSVIVQLRSGDCYLLECDSEGGLCDGPYSLPIARLMRPGAAIYEQRSPHFSSQHPPATEYMLDRIGSFRLDEC